ncbi:receptor-like protein 9DC3 [Tripterygium wilfordii]|uniref:receptor-like protein 9DC3 n=1 Tax=Tripterygium wilfordii TaxID=458696 RepID=UPI0018F8579A|nr:receptor-like protein 9DC3 [Tripterygium wilfordii]
MAILMGQYGRSLYFLFLLDGVTCDTVTGRVIGLDLSRSLLQGSLFSNNSLFQLSHLQKLNLAHNDFSDSKISPNFGQFRSLAHLNLSSSSFLGEVPYEISHLSNLISLDSSFNGSNWSSPLQDLHLDNVPFTGELPESIGDLNSLKQLTIGYCNFTGSIPVSIGNLQELTYFKGDVNNFNGRIPSSLTNLSKLQVLSLQSNKLVGPLPNFSNLSKLVRLDLYWNSLNGTIQSVLDNLPSSLHSLVLSKNQFTGPINEFHSQSLEKLDLGDNKLNGSIPSSIFNLVNLTSLDLSLNSFSGTLDASMFSKLQNLQELRLSDNDISFTTIHQHNCQSHITQSKDFVSCNVTEFPYFLRGLKVLYMLDLANNRLYGQVPEWLLEVGIDTLSYLNLANNSLTGIKELPWKRDSFFDLQDCKDSHCFPNLQLFDISNNEFSGPLPARYFENLQAMIKAEEGSGEGNVLGTKTSSYQDSVFVVKKGQEYQLVRIIVTFKTIDFSNNKFRGEIPNAIGKLIYLKGLNFSHNSIRGGIPSSFGNLRNLEWLDLSSNRLTGKIPGQLTSLTFLTRLNLSQNELVGPIPQVKQFYTFDNTSYVENLRLCGYPLSMACDNNGEIPQPPPSLQEKDDSGSWFDWTIIAMGYSSGLVMGLSAGYISSCFCRWYNYWHVYNILKEFISPSLKQRMLHCTFYKEKLQLKCSRPFSIEVLHDIGPCCMASKILCLSFFFSLHVV